MSGDSERGILTVGNTPAYPDVPTYRNLDGQLHIWEGDGWKETSLSWKTGCYIASNLSGIPELTYSGPDAQEFLSRLSINNVHKWPIGTSKHLVMPDENGFIANHALTVRDSEDSFRQFASMAPWPVYRAQSLGLDVRIGTRDIFLYQVAGPTSLQVLERLLGKDLRDVAFLAIRKITIPGVDAEADIELSRIGMAGTLAYELRGPLKYGPAVFDAVYQAGKDFGIKRLHVPALRLLRRRDALRPRVRRDGPSGGPDGQRRPERRPRPAAHPARGELGLDGQVRPRLPRP
jgi:vanillate/3-O-methylgallate O-demethylase